MRTIPHRSNFPLALLCGLFTSIVLAILWAYISYLTGYQIGWMAIVVGYTVGIVVQITGKGRTFAFALLGATLALLTCVAGNLLVGCMHIAHHHNMALLDLLKQVDLTLAGHLLTDTFLPMDLLFYGISVYEGFKFSLATVSKQANTIPVSI